MARMYARKKGKSKSSKPIKSTVPIEMSVEEIQKHIVELRNQGMSSSRIGIVLRDKYGIPDIMLAAKKKMTHILQDNDVAPKVPEDLYNLIVKALNLREHLEDNKKDLHNRRALQLTESKIRRLVKYYKGRGVLPEEWTYRLERAETLISQ
jgi:small subunit ribosomal protein S15